MKNRTGKYAAFGKTVIKGALLCLLSALLLTGSLAMGEEEPASNGIELLLCVTENGRSTSGTEADGIYDFSILKIRGETGEETEAAAVSLQVEQGRTARQLLPSLSPGEYLIRAAGENATLFQEEKRIVLDGEGIQTALFVLDLKHTGTLTVAAAPAEGRDADLCAVTVTLSDARINGVYGPAVFAYGRATLRLTSGEEAEIPGLPAGVEYTVTEEDGLALIDYPEPEGPHRIPDGGNARATLVRPQNTLGRLKLSCSYVGNGADPDRVFAFLVRLEDHPLTGRYGDMTFRDGVAEVLLKSGEICVASGLPDGIRYDITSGSCPEDGTVNSAGETGVLQGGRESAAGFVFARQAGGLRISLNCAGNDREPGRAFRIRVRLTDGERSPLTGYDEAPFRGGTAVLPMKDGEIACLDLPEGACWQVLPEDASAEGFRRTDTGATEGASEGGQLNIRYERSTYGGFRIAALSAGNGEAPEDPAFILALNDGSVSGQYGDVRFENGLSVNRDGGNVITLQKGGLLWVTGLPNGVEYFVTMQTKENEPEAWKAENGRGIVTGTSADSGSGDADGLVILTPWERIIPDPLPAGLSVSGGEMTLRGQVCLMDGKPEDGRFAFTAVEEGREAARGTALDGEVVFDGIAGLKEGVHEWTVTQDPGAGDGVLYDRGTRRILFSLEKAEDGTLKGSVLPCSDPLVFADRVSSVRFCAQTPSGSRTRGEEIRVTDAEGKTAARWTTNGLIHTVYGLKAGTYTWEGNHTAGTFELTEEGAVLQDGRSTDCIMLPEEEPLYLGLIKTDTAGDPLKGAVIEVRDRYGNVADSWTTDERIHWMAGLRQGETYTLVETRPAAGYTKWIGEMTLTAEGVETSLEVREEDGTALMILRTEKPTVRVLLRDGETGEAAPGAALCVTDGDGNTAAEWTSGETAYQVTGLSTGTEYTLWQKTAAPGFREVKQRTAFRVDEDGAVLTDGELEGRDLIVMETVRTAFAVFRTDEENGGILSGAALVMRDAAGYILDEWISDGRAHLVRGLPAGLEVTVSERTPPEGYRTGEERKGIQTDADTPAEVTVSSRRTRVTVLRTDESGQEIPEGGVCRVLDEDGVPFDEWTGSGHEIIGLKAGTWTVRELTPPAGYVLAEDRVFEVAPDGSAPDTVSLSGSRTSLTVSVADVASGKALSGAALQVLDPLGGTVGEWVSGEDKWVLTGLSVNTDYRLHEAQAPENYGTEEDVPFRLDGDGRLARPAGEELVLLTRRRTCEMMITNIIQGETSQRRFAYRLEMRLDGRRLPDSCRYAVLNGKGEVISSGALISGVSVECGPDETIRLTGLPAGCEYTVTEKNHDGYFCVVSVNGGRAAMTETAKGVLDDPENTVMLVFANAAQR